MTKTTLNRIERLELIETLLKQGDVLTVEDLASRLNVSTRTATRDIELLRDQGLPIEADRGRGGGIRLSARWGIGRMNLNYTEAVDLLVSLAIAEKMQSQIFLGNLRSIRQKLVASFSPEKRQRVERLKNRVVVGGTASFQVQQSFSPKREKIVGKLHEAFVEMQPSNIIYRSESDTKTSRVIEPHYLLLNYPVWYVLAWDRLREAKRTFRLDRIEKATVADGHFKLIDRDEFAGSWGDTPI